MNIQNVSSSRFYNRLQTVNGLLDGSVCQTAGLPVKNRSRVPANVLRLSHLPVNFVRPAAAYPSFCVILRLYVTCLSVCASVCIVRCGLDNRSQAKPATHQQPPVGRQQLGRGRQIWIDSARTVAGARARAAASVML